jgi:hypothetical protein
MLKKKNLIIFSCKKRPFYHSCISLVQINKRGGWVGCGWEIVVPRPSASALLTGRRQKALKSFLHSLTICDKVASGNNKNESKEGLLIRALRETETKTETDQFSTRTEMFGDQLRRGKVIQLWCVKSTKLH